MFRSMNRTGVTAVCSLAVLAFAASGVRAQPFLPIYPGGPTYRQYLANVQAFGQALRSVPPYALGYNPYLRPAVVNYPVVPAYAAYTASPGYDPSLYANPYASYGGSLRGAADVIDAQGRFAVQQQQAVLVREQVKTARLDNRRRQFDQDLYERERTPTAEDERARLRAQQVRHALNDPPPSEIWSAQALNDLLGELQTQAARRVLQTHRGPREPLGPDVLKQINVAPANRGGDIGLLKDGGRLHWPWALATPDFQVERERLNGLAQDAVTQARFNHRVDAGSLRQMNGDLDRMQQRLSRTLVDLPPSQAIEARRFLNRLGEALKVLGQPDAASYFNGKYAARGHTVPELVKHMTDSGLCFAPAVAGDEAAYLAMHRALAAHVMSVQHPQPR
jgi:hypothetical protein